MNSIISLILFAMLFTPSLAIGQIQFQEVTDDAGISYTGTSFGASWGDFNRDGWPDLWVSNHSSPPHLYLNQGNGTFREIATQVVDNLKGDTHGAAWADFDNDGDQDLIELVGAQCGTGTGSNHLFINNEGLLQDQASTLGLQYPLGRGRTPLWFDWDGDGALDVLLANFERQEAPSALFWQTPMSFQDVSDVAGLQLSKSAKYVHLSDLNADGRLDLVCHGWAYPQKVYSVVSFPLEDLTNTIGLSQTPNVYDTAIADFNGDLRSDLYLCRSLEASDALQIDANKLEARLRAYQNEVGIKFRSEGDILFSIFPSWRIAPTEIFIGSDGHNPAGLSFTLSPQDLAVWGIQEYNPGVDSGIYIGFDDVSQVWQLLSSNININTVIETNLPISDFTLMGFDPFAPALNDRLLIQTANGFDDWSMSGDLDIPTACEAVTTGDFDNDMCVDVYLVCTGPVKNMANILLVNQGDGTFISVPNAGGAAGSSLGRGENGVTADYDGDGFLDLFITNGRGEPPFCDDGPSQLFRNLGNDNNWIEIDLEGVVSNRDGIGARVLATAGGRTQLREQGGGAHMFAQNHQRIHFGLGSNTTIDHLVIQWPSGIVQEVGNIPANQILHVIEPSSPSLLGKPAYQPGVNAGVFLWKDTFDGPYHLDVSGDGPVSVFSVKVIADKPIDSVTPRKLEFNDALEWNANYITLDSRVTTWIDGVDFQLPPKTNAMIAVEKDAEPNPRQLHVGALGAPLIPCGWILDASGFSEIPGFRGGQDLGMFVGHGTSGEVRARWNGDGPVHRAEVEFLFSKSPDSVVPVGLELNDVFVATTNSVAIDSFVSTWWDGVDISVRPGTVIGLRYTQDGLFQHNRVNPTTRDLGLPNAYWLPRAVPYGKPSYDPSAEAGLFLWKDESSGVWHLRGTAGGSHRRYTGEIISDQPVSSVLPKGLEANDVLNSTDVTRIIFDLGMWNHWQDGFDFQFPSDAVVHLDLQAQAGEDPARAIRIGAGRWPVEQVPLDISGW